MKEYLPDRIVLGRVRFGGNVTRNSRCPRGSVRNSLVRSTQALRRPRSRTYARSASTISAVFRFVPAQLKENLLDDLVEWTVMIEEVGQLPHSDECGRLDDGGISLIR